MAKTIYKNYCKTMRFLGAAGVFILGGYNVNNGGSVVVNAIVTGLAISAIYICSTPNE